MPSKAFILHKGRCGGPDKDLFEFGLVWGEPSRRLGLATGSLGLRLLGQKHSLDVGQDTTLGDGDTGQKLVQLLVVADGKLKVTGDDSGLLVVTGSVSCQLENFGGEVLENGSQVDWSSGTDTLGIVAFAEETVDTSDGELKSGTGRAGLALSLDFSSFAASRHDESFVEVD